MKIVNTKLSSGQCDVVNNDSPLKAAMFFVPVETQKNVQPPITQTKVFVVSRLSFLNGLDMPKTNGVVFLSRG